MDKDTLIELEEELIDELRFELESQNLPIETVERLLEIGRMDIIEDFFSNFRT